MDDFKGWTDEELSRFIATGEEPKRFATPTPNRAPSLGQMVTPSDEPSEFVATVKERAALPKQAEPDYTRGMGAGERFLAGVGAGLQEPVLGAKEKVELAFPGAGKAGQEEIKRIAAERAARRQDIRELTQTPAGQAGHFVGQAVPMVLGGPRALGQAAMAGLSGFLGGGPDEPKGIGGELAGSAMRGATDAAITGAITKGLTTAGTAVNAARGRMIPAGEEAMKINAAAERLGLPPMSVGQLSPSSRAAGREVGTQEHSLMIDEQARALAEKIAGRRQVPADVGPGTVEQVVPGAGLQDAMKASVQKVMDNAKAKYTAVDDFVQQNGLSGISPQYTYNTLKSINAKLTPKGKTPDDNMVYQMMEHYNPDVFKYLQQQVASGLNPQQLVQAGMPMSVYHDLRVAAGKARSSLDRTLASNVTKEQLTAKKELNDLIKALDNDAERWATQNAGNKEAMDLYNNAKEYYSKVVAPTVMENRVARKLISKRSPYPSAQQLYSDIISPGNAEFLDRLLPYMQPSAQDALAVMRGAPEIGKAMYNRAAPAITKGGGFSTPLEAASRASHPLQALAGRTNLAKRLYFAQPGQMGPLSSIAAQYPAQGTEEAVRNRLGQR